MVTKTFAELIDALAVKTGKSNSSILGGVQCDTGLALSTCWKAYHGTEPIERKPAVKIYEWAMGKHQVKVAASAMCHLES